MFYERYCRLCKDRGKAPSTAAVEMGISKSAVTTWKKLGRTPKIDQLKKIADYFDVSLDYLMDETDDPYDWDADPDARLATVYGPQWDYLMKKHHEDVSAAWEDWVGFQEDLEKDARDTRYEEDEEAENKNAPVVKNHESNDWAKKAGAIPYDPTKVAPLLGTVRAGLPMYAEENIEDYLPIRQTDGARYFWLTVRGDSMNAVGIAEGDQLLVREQPEVENGQLAVVLVNGDEATVKYFRREGDLVILTPKSFNPVHQPQVYDLKKIPVRVLGLVVECRKVF